MSQRVPRFTGEEASTYTYLHGYMPSFLSLLNPTASQLRTIRRKLDDRYDQVAAELHANRVFQADTTVFDLLWESQERQVHSLRFLGYIETTCASLLPHIPQHLLPALRANVFRMLVNFDRHNSRYRSYVGELSVLNALLSSGQLRLDGIEVPLPNGKHVDYRVALETGTVLVEVENIDFDASKVSSVDNLREFMRGRTEEKLKDKFGGLPDDWSTPFCLVPVLWGDMLALHRFKDYFAEPLSQPVLVLQPMMVAQFAAKDSAIPHYKFLTASGYMELTTRAKERGDL